MRKLPGEVFCIGRPSHRMIEVVPKKLWLCECHASGPLVNLKGAVDEARRLVNLSGGYDVMRQKQISQFTAAQTARRREKSRRQRGYDSAGKQLLPRQLPPPVD